MTEADLRHLEDTSAPISDEERVQAAKTIRDMQVALSQAATALFGLIEHSSFNLVSHLHRQREFSQNTFGPGIRTRGVVDHIRKELAEIEAAPTDVSEWIDVVILAFDGAWRTGASPELIVEALQVKQARNESRDWPDWRTVDTDRAIEHVRTGEAANAA